MTRRSTTGSPFAGGSHRVDEPRFTAGEVAVATDIPPQEIQAACHHGEIEHEPSDRGYLLIPGRELDRLLRPTHSPMGFGELSTAD